MLKYTVKRLLQSLVTIFLIATAVFLMMRCLPTDYYFTEEQLMKFTDQQKTAALEAAGLTVQEVKEKRGWECIVCKKA